MFLLKFGELEPVSFPSLSAVVICLQEWEEMLRGIIQEYSSETKLETLISLTSLMKHDFNKKPVVQIYKVKSIYVPETIVVVKKGDEDAFTEGTDRAFE